MRVTANTFTNSLVEQLTQLSQRQNRLQTEVATGQRVRLPEDDPSAMRRTLDMQGESAEIVQYKRNLGNLNDIINSTFEVMRGLKKVSDRAGELATLSDGTKPPDELKLYATEVTQLIKQAVQVANTKFRGEHLLGGTKTDVPPFAITTDANGNVTAVTYQGNQSVSECEMAEGLTIGVRAVGANNTGNGPRGLLSDNRYGSDFFNHLISLQNHLLAGDTGAIANGDLPNLNADEENILMHYGESGAIQSRLNTSEDLADKRIETLETLVSNEVDADLATTIVRLNQTQVAYQAALQSSASMLQSSLLDYLQ
jgi:flagellar hook-associated protein 3 FlgL